MVTDIKSNFLPCPPPPFLAEYDRKEPRDKGDMYGNYSAKRRLWKEIWHLETSENAFR